MEGEKFEQKTEKLELKRFADLRGKYLSDYDLTGISFEVMVTTEFDTLTTWPTVDKMPTGFDPKKILEEGKNPGLGIRRLHERGINGQGVLVAILDQRLDVNHLEYKDSLKSCDSYDEVQSEETSMHGPAVVSLLVGKECGVAPGAELYYKEIPSKDEGRTWDNYAKALNDIIDHNTIVEEKDKIKVVSCSLGYPNGKIFGDLNVWITAIEHAKKSGIFFIDSNTLMGYFNCIGGGSFGGREDFQSYKSWLYHNRSSERDQELKALLDEGDVKKIFDLVRKKGDARVKNMKDEELKALIGEEIKMNIRKGEKNIIVPSDYRTIASAHDKPNQYSYCGRGGISWSIPYLAGISALAMQIKPDITTSEFYELINKTTVTNKAGLKIINPEGIIEELEKVTKAQSAKDLK